MHETLKSTLFVVIALLVVGIAWVTQPAAIVEQAQDMRGQVLFAEFDDPLKAASLEILEYDEQTATVRPFKVALVNDRWSIPSHDNYPADARDHLASAATSLMQRKVLDVPSDSPGDHAMFGVIDPDPKKLDAGAVGVGKRVTMRDKNDKILLNLIIGKEVPGREGLRYVRVVGQDPVYIVQLKTDKLSTRFEDWIEKDLLKLNSWDIRRVAINDYSIDALRGVLNARSRLTVEYNDTGDPRWKILDDQVLQETGWAPRPMAPDEEPNTAKLDDMRNALDDLKIVDVLRKPAELSAALRETGKISPNPQIQDTLAPLGFHVLPAQQYFQFFPNPVAGPSGPDDFEILSTEGEVYVTMKDGVEYVLRFGQVAGTSSPSADKDKKEGDKKKEDADQDAGRKAESKKEDSPSAGVNRFLFVMAQFNKTVIPPPDLQPLPEEKPAEQPKPATDPASGDQAKPASAEGQNQEAKPDEAKKDLAAERKRIEEENKRKQDEYEEKIKKGEERVKELNERFADWYYIISDEVYQKIHLGRKDVIKKKEPPKEEGKKESHDDHDHAAGEASAAGDKVSDFQKLKDEGLPRD